MLSRKHAVRIYSEMKSVNKIKEKKRKITKKPKIKASKEKVLIVAQEIKFARLLSGNEKKTRDRVLKSFKKWLLNCFEREYEFKEDDFTRVWKGLFYAVWMSDKPLVQEELCETIAGILDLFPPEQIRHALLMMKAGFKVLATEWYGIDHHRMDKFLMLVRRYLRGSLRCLLRCKWKLEVCKLYADHIAGTDGILALKTPLYARNAGSMLLHVVDCFLEELAKVSEGDIPPPSVVELLRPFCSYMVHGSSPVLCQAARRLLTQLLRQSDRGLEYGERTRAWKQMGCPRGGPDALELESDDEEDIANGHDEEEEPSDAEKVLDPRAGRVDVVLHTIPVPATGLAELLKELLATASSKAHKRTKICLQRFEQLAKDEYPLRVEDVLGGEDAAPRNKPAKAARALSALEKRLAANSDELALRGLRRKHRKRLLAKTRAGLSILDDVPRNNITSTNGEWAVEATEPKDKKTDKQSNDEKKHEDKNNKKLKHSQAEEKSSKKSKNNVKSKSPEKMEKLKQKTLDSFVQKTEITKTKQETVIGTAKHKQNAVEKVVKTDSKQKDSKITKNSPPHEESKFSKSSNSKFSKTKPKFSKNTSPNQKNLDKSPIKTEKNKVLNGKVEKIQLTKNMYTPKKVKFVLKNNSMQGTIDYYKSVRQSPSIPFDSSRKPTKTNLKVSTPSPINPFFKKKLRHK